MIIKKHPQFRKYYVGQRVRYTGPTTYYRQPAQREPGTITSIGNSITIELDRNKPPYLDQDLCYNVPQKRLGIVSIGDLVTKGKKVEII